MSIASEITRLQNAKAAIKTAIEGKGVTVPDATLFDGMASLIDAIEAGGGGEFVVEHGTRTFSETVYPATTPIVIDHSLGKTPLFFLGVAGTDGYYARFALTHCLKVNSSALDPVQSSYDIISYSSNVGSSDLSSSAERGLITWTSSQITIGGSSWPTDVGLFVGTYSGPPTLNWFVVGKKS